MIRSEEQQKKKTEMGTTSKGTLRHHEVSQCMDFGNAKGTRERNREIILRINGWELPKCD